MSNLSFAELLSFETVRDGTLVRLNGQELHEANARDLAEELFDVASKGNGPHLYLDFDAVETLSSYVLLRLIVLDRKLQDLGDRLVLLNTRPRVREAIQASHLSDVLNVR
jgi:anti-anti-sigma factor